MAERLIIGMSGASGAPLTVELLRQLRSLTYLHDKSFMLLDEATRRNLELTSRIRDGKRTCTLLGVLDKTHTPQGARLLGKWIDRPLQDEKAINLRLGAL